MVECVFLRAEANNFLAKRMGSAGFDKAAKLDCIELKLEFPAVTLERSCEEGSSQESRIFDIVLE